MTRRALCIGTNYVGTSSQLAGCVNDADDWADVLADRGFESPYSLTDASATRARMLESMSDLIAETGPDDLAVITWSGHGSWQVDRSGDEPDRRDEVICPHDYSRAGMISDDDLYRVFTSGHRWARVVFISDSCHSGSVNRLAGPLGQETVPSSPVLKLNRPTHPEEIRTLQERLRQGIEADRPIILSQDMEVIPLTAPARRAKFLPPEEWLQGIEEFADARRAELAPSRGRPRASALLLAGCKDTQTAMDAWFEGRANGAFTYAALKALSELKEPATYRDWMRQINKYLPSIDFPDQAPQLEAGPGQRRWLILSEEGER